MSSLASRAFSLKRSGHIPRKSLSGKALVLIVGCGDVGMRVLRQWQALGNGRVTVRVLTSSLARMSQLRALGATPLLGNLDDSTSLRRLAGLADKVIHLAPPPTKGAQDTRSKHLRESLRRSLAPVQHLVYASTTGVYGDAGGACFDETRPVAPATDRARRRVDAESVWRQWGGQSSSSPCRRALSQTHATRPTISLLRIPGIYAFDREGGNPLDRLKRGMPVLEAQDDVYTNHIHADDLAAACIAALWRGRPGRAYHVCDDAQRLTGDYFDALADVSGLPRPVRISRAEAQASFSPMQMSFLSESRRLLNRRLKTELRVSLRYPDVLDAIAKLN